MKFSRCEVLSFARGVVALKEANGLGHLFELRKEAVQYAVQMQKKRQEVNLMNVSPNRVV